MPAESPKPGRIPRLRSLPDARRVPRMTVPRVSPPATVLAPRLVDLVEHASVGEEALLRLLPSAEGVVDREEPELRELRGMARRRVRGSGSVVVARRDLLAGRGVEEL